MSLPLQLLFIVSGLLLAHVVYHECTLLTYMRNDLRMPLRRLWPSLIIAIACTTAVAIMGVEWLLTGALSHLTPIGCGIGYAAIMGCRSAADALYHDAWLRLPRASW